MDWSRAASVAPRARRSRRASSRALTTRCARGARTVPENSRRHALVVLSDGIDSVARAATLEGALRKLLEEQVAVYVISNNEIERARKRSELDTCSRDGRLVRFNELRIGTCGGFARARRERAKPRRADERGAVASQAAERYLLSTALRRDRRGAAQPVRALLHALQRARDGRFRRVKVEVPNRPLQVNTRRLFRAALVAGRALAFRRRFDRRRNGRYNKPSRRDCQNNSP